MKNSIIPQEELDAVQKVIKSVEELVEVHAKSRPNFNNETKVEVVHTFTCLNCIGELIKTTRALKELFEMSEEKFCSIATENGKRTIDKVLEAQTMGVLIDSLSEILKS